MRILKYFLLGTLFVCCMWFIGFIVWFFMDANEKARVYLVNYIRPLLNDKFNVQKLDVGFVTLRLDNITLLPKSERLAIEIDAIEIKYSLIQLVLKKFDPKKAVESIRIVHPDCKIAASHPLQDTSITSVFERISLPEIFLMYGDIAHKLNFLNRILIEDGSFYQIKGNEKPELVASGVSGWFTTRSDLYTEVGLKGQFASDLNQNFSLSGLLDSPNQDYRFWIKFDNISLNAQSPFQYFSQVKFNQGRFDGTFLVQYSGKEQGTKKVSVSGRFNVLNGDGRITKPDISVSHVQAKGTILNDSLTLELFQGEVDRIPLKVWGCVPNIFHREMDVSFESVQVPLNLLNRKFEMKIPANLEGNVFVQGHITGSPQSVSFDGVIEGTTLTIGTYHLDYFKCYYAYQHPKIIFKDFSGSITGITFKGDGELKLSSDYPVKFHLDGFTNLDFIKNKFAILRSLEDRARLSLTIQGTLKNPEGQVDVTFGKEKETLAITGIFDTKNGFHVSGKSAGNGFNFDVRLNNENNRKIWNIQIKEPLKFLTALWDVPVIGRLAPETESTISIQRDDTLWDIRSTAVKLEGPRKRSQLFYSLTSSFTLKDNFWNFSSVVDYYPNSKLKYTARVDVEYQEGVYHIKKFEVPEIMQGILTIKTGEHYSFDGWLSIDANVINLQKLFLTQPKVVKQGKLLGSIKVREGENGPEFTGKVELQDATIETVAGYRAAIEFNLPDYQHILINKYSLHHLKRLVAEGSGIIDRTRDSINLSIKGPSINVDTLLTTLSGSSGIVQGSVALDIVMKGPIADPVFIGNCVISNGAVEGIRFDEIRATLTEPFVEDSLRSPIGRGNYYPQGIWISNYAFIREGQYTLQGKGYLPFNKTDDIDFLAQGEGNFLAMLADISNGFFTYSNSSGTAMFRIAGPYDAITLGSCALDIYGGRLHPQSVIPEVSNIRLKAELPAGERFLKFYEFYGDVGGSRLSISNSMDFVIKTEEGDSIRMEPLLLTEDGLTWGVMSFTTDPKLGYTFSLPGLQDPKDWGTYVVLGKNDQEQFYFAGPSDHPVVRGRVLIRNTRVTFPFLGPPITKPGTVQKFLERINWDVLVHADKNVEYFRVEPSSLRAITDDIYIRVDLDNGGQGLWFTGAIEDGSFAINGKVTSSRGRLEFLDMNFRVQYINATFDKYNQFPEVSGRARTTIRDSTGIPRDVYAVIYSKDTRTGEELQNVKWENLKFRLVMDKPLESLPGVEQSQEDILRLLGYSTQDFAKKAPDVAGLKADNAFFRPFLRPMERSIKNLFQLDQVDIRPNIARNLTHNLIAGGYSRYGDLGGVGQALFQSSYLILGKYLSNDFYFTYTGQLASGYNVHDKEVLGFNHLIGVEYRVGPGILLQLEYDRQFNKFRNKEDTRFWVRRYFTLRD